MVSPVARVAGYARPCTMKHGIGTHDMNFLRRRHDVAKVRTYESHALQNPFQSPQVALGADEHGHFFSTIQQAPRKIRAQMPGGSRYQAPHFRKSLSGHGRPK